MGQNKWAAVEINLKLVTDMCVWFIHGMNEFVLIDWLIDSFIHSLIDECFHSFFLQHSQLGEQHLRVLQSLDSVHSATTGLVCQMMSEQLIVLRRCSLHYIFMLRSSCWCSAVVANLGLNLSFLFFVICYWCMSYSYPVLGSNALQ